METPQPITTTQWLGRAHALVRNVDPIDGNELKTAMGVLGGQRGNDVKDAYAKIVAQILYRAFAIAELSAPASAQGAFIAAGEFF